MTCHTCGRELNESHTRVRHPCGAWTCLARACWPKADAASAGRQTLEDLMQECGVGAVEGDRKPAR